MKIVVIILGVLAFIGGLAVFGLVAGSGSEKTMKTLLLDSQQQGTEAIKKWEKSGDPKDKAEADKWKESEKEITRSLEKKESEQITGFLFGGVLVVVGIGLFGLSFMFRKKE